MKILSLDELATVITGLKSEGKKIIHCHGCFDLMHVGHIKYFQASKKMGDILVVTVTPDRFVDKGPNRPLISEELRVDSIAALECVDYAAVNCWPTAENTLRMLLPDYYVKGQEFQKLQDTSGKIQKEAEVVIEIGSEMRFTHEIVFSSTKLIKDHIQIKGS
jgi:rfaE bifunctional protein nucleotidyltransferase chain/domain